MSEQEQEGTKLREVVRSQEAVDIRESFEKTIWNVLNALADEIASQRDHDAEKIVVSGDDMAKACDHVATALWTYPTKLNMISCEYLRVLGNMMYMFSPPSTVRSLRQVMGDPAERAKK